MRNPFRIVRKLLCLSVLVAAASVNAAQLTQPANTWVKLSPLDNTPVSPRLGYEGACAWDSRHRVWIRYGGHNQGGGGEQNAELWTFDPLTAKWTLKEPNLSPPGLCCAQQDVFDPTWGRFIRFPAFSGSHGWQWFREIYLNDSATWAYDLETNLWRNLRPAPAPQVSPLRGASWDSDAQVIVLFAGEGNKEGTQVYDPYTNTWTRMSPPRQPIFRSGGNMAYDSARKVHILFGAQFEDDPHTWAYDLRKNEWRDLQPATMPPANQNDAVLAYDSLNRVVVALVKISEGKDENEKHRIETWVFDAGRNEWKKMNPPREPDPSGNRVRVMGFAPELGLTLLENCTNPPHAAREQQMWTYCYAPAKEPQDDLVEPPTDLRVVTGRDDATLTWKASPSKGVTEYVVYRGAGEKPWLLNYERVGRASAGQTRYDDKGLQRSTVYYYLVQARRDKLESVYSVKVRTQPRIVEDAVVSVLSPSRVEVSWTAPPGEDVAGYFVERAPVEVWTEDQLKRLKSPTAPLDPPSVGAIRRIGPFVRLNRPDNPTGPTGPPSPPSPTRPTRPTSPIRATSYTDSVDLTKPAAIAGEPLLERRFSSEQLDAAGKPYRFAVYAYRIRAVNALGVESGPSPFFLTLPSAPQWLFSKEEGTACRLKWAKNPEKNLKGYRVYRLDGRWEKDPLSRLTPEPIADATFADPTAGKTTRRYHVLAVDALGQEGLPSMPVWFDREWARFYVPFVGEWHQ